MEEKPTTIELSKETRDKLKHRKRGDETYDEYFVRLMTLEECTNK